MKALTVRQPWAWLIVNGYKPVENRTWATTYRGPVLIHAAASLADPQSLMDCYALCETLGIELPDEVDCGGIVGQVQLIDCVKEHPSPWFSGPVGWLLSDPQPLPFRAYKGRLGLFDISE